MQSFRYQDIISTFDKLNKNHTPWEFIFSKNQDYVVCYNLYFDDDTQYTKVII